MSKPETTSASTGGLAEVLSPAEASLGQVLALIHRVLPRLDEPARGRDVQASLRKAATCLEAARAAHEHDMAASTSVESEIVAIISAAVAAVLDRPFRLVAVQPMTAAVPHLNVWALEGRTQIFHSHKVR